MTITELLAVLYPPSQTKRLTPQQEAILRHPRGPAWVLAGPGSGKTEVLTGFVLRLLYVSNDPVQGKRIPPESVFVTTFTEKAARNLEDRIAGMRARLIASDPSLQAIDISKLRVGTLHGLCNDLLQEFRAPNYQNVRLMDEFEQALFVREHMSLIKKPNPPAEIAFWGEFSYLFTPVQWQPTRTYAPSRWNSAKALVTLLNRLIEDRVSISSLKAVGGQLARLGALYEEYVQHLRNSYRCDFSQLQGRFLEFLDTPVGLAFLEGDGSVANPGIQWVLVDEYQDTNPIQEEIYFRLAARPPHNLVVVGDDDQAMYRFRGGSVECMVTFDDACKTFLGISKAEVGQYPLVGNFRSHPDIVRFFDEYIGSFPVLQQPGARAPKPSIVAQRIIRQNYPAVGMISARTKEDLAEMFAVAVQDLVTRRVLNDPNECCLLLKSTKESPNNAGPYVEALERIGMRVYNPRNKAFMEQEEVQSVLGAILAIIDPDRRYALDPANQRQVPDEEAFVRASYDRIAAAHRPLANYVTRSTAAIRAKAGQPFDCSLQELLYYLISLEPFSTWLQDPVRRIRLAKVTGLLEAFSSMPILDPATGQPRPNVTRGYMRGSADYPGEVHGPWLGSFYSLFIGYITQTGFDDEEDEEVICPPGMVPIMTMHQSKGLEFPFVFVGHLGEGPKVSASHKLETLFSGYPANPGRSFPRVAESERAEMDLIRQYYVAFSRAKYALILVGTAAQFNKRSIPCGPAPQWLRRRIHLLEA
jgi:ATP-dependent DNA helicase UvrD/PcrA